MEQQSAESLVRRLWLDYSIEGGTMRLPIVRSCSGFTPRKPVFSPGENTGLILV